MAEATPLKGDAVVIGEAPKKWRHGLCDCFGDCMVCCAVCCCNAVTTGQIYEKAVRANLINRIAGMGCMAVFLLLIFCYVGHNILVATGTYNQFDSQMYQGEDGTWYSNREDSSMEAPWQTQLAESVLFIASIVTCCIVCNVRKAIRTRDQIKPSCCPDCCDDACCTMFCGACTECLILRHEGVTSQKYSLCSPIAVKV